MNVIFMNVMSRSTFVAYGTLRTAMISSELWKEFKQMWLGMYLLAQDYRILYAHYCQHRSVKILILHARLTIL